MWSGRNNPDRVWNPVRVNTLQRFTETSGSHKKSGMPSICYTLRVHKLGLHVCMRTRTGAGSLSVKYHKLDLRWFFRWCRAKCHFARTKQSLRSTTLKLLNVKQDACDTMLENLQKIGNAPGVRFFMPIRIRRQDNKYQATQVVGHTDIIVAAFAVSKACYMGQKPGIGKLCGSI